MRRPTSTTALAALAALAFSTPADARGDSPAYALVIGNNDPPAYDAGQGLQRLRFADDDAVRYHQIFSRFAETRLLAVLDSATQRRYPGIARQAEPPTLARLKQSLDFVAARMARDRTRGARPVFYLAFSGHGARSPRHGSYLALQDGPLTRRVLHDEIVARLPASRIHLIVDACHAAGLVDARGGFFAREADARSVPLPKQPRRLEEGLLERFAHVGVLLASSDGAQSHEWSEVEAGVFSHELLSGLLGAADVNGDLRIEYTEIQAFVAAANRSVADPRAAPAIVAQPPRVDRNAELVALRRLSGTRLLRGDASRLGHFYLELANGQRYLDAHLGRDSRAALAIPAAETVFLRNARLEGRVPAGAVVRFEAIALRELVSSARGSVESALRRGLFKVAFGRRYYEGFVDSIQAVGVAFADAPSIAAAPAAASGRTRQRAAIALLATAAAGVTATAVLGGLTAGAASDVAATELERPAHEAHDRYQRLAIASVATAATAVAAGLIAWWLWPTSEVRASRASAPGLRAGAALRFCW